MRNCIWCNKNSDETDFNKKAHTVPKSLGGEKYNQNVCDKCNEFFGNKHTNGGSFSIETALKEVFNISRHIYIDSSKNIKRKTKRYTSQFFEIKERKGKKRIIVKNQFKFENGFQDKLARSFKRGLYKMVFEELERKTTININEFKLIRDFCLNDIGDLPVIYFRRKYGAILLSNINDIQSPKLIFNRMKYLFSNDYFIEIEFLGHVFGLQLKQIENKSIIDRYIEESFILKKEGNVTFFQEAIFVKRITDIDLTLEILSNKK